MKTRSALAVVLLAPPVFSQEPGTSDSALLEGEVALGLRLLDVGGSRAQYDEDVNLDEGAVLRALELRARNLRDLPLESLELSARGVGEPFAAYRLETRGGPWRTVGRFDRGDFRGNAQGDQHPFELERRSGTLDLEYRPAGSSTRSSFGFERTVRDRLAVGSRAVGLESVAGFPVHGVHTTTGVRAAFASELGPWELELAGGLRALDSRDRLAFEQPSPRFPGTDVAEDFRADQGGTGAQGHLGLARAVGRGGGSVALDLDWRTLDLDGDARWHESAFFVVPSTPFERDTLADVVLAHDELVGEVHYLWPLAGGAELDLGYRREQERIDGRLVRTSLTDELTGDPPSVLVQVDTNEREGALDLLSLGARAPVGALELGAELEWGGEDLRVSDVSDGVEVRRFDGRVHEFGGRATLACPLGAGWTLDLGAGHARRPAESSEVGVDFQFGDDRATFGSLACRWRGAASSAGAEARLEHRSSDALTSQGDVATCALSCAGALGAHARAEARAAWRSFELESDTTFLFFDPLTGLSEVPGVATFDGEELAAGAALELDLGGLRPRLALDGSRARGDSRYLHQNARLTLPWDAGGGFELGLELAWLDFAGDGALDASDYDARIVEVFVRRAWGR